MPLRNFTDPVRGLRRARQGRLSARRRGGNGCLPGDADVPAALPRGRPGCRQDRARAGAGRGRRGATRAAAVLRGNRRQPGALRLGLPAAGTAPACGRRHRRPGQPRGLALRPSVPRRAPDPAGTRDQPVRAAHRRDRPRGRRVRGVPARGARRLRGDAFPNWGPFAPRRPRWSSSPRTGRARCTTRSSAAASTTGSSTRASSARSRSCAGTSRTWRSSSARDVAAVVGKLREADLLKPPGIAETIDWTQALHMLGGTRLDGRAGHAQPSAR